jgi:hypothetical protein
MNTKDNVFMSSRRVCSDDCAKEARDLQNDGIYGYSMYHFQPVACKDPLASMPAFSYDHVNLRGRVGYGLAEDCVVDRYSSLRNDPAALTRDRCKTQLFSRIFQGCPNLKPGVPNPDLEMPIQQGLSSTTVEGTQYVCKKTIMERQTYNPIPLVSCMQDIQDPNHIVEPWVRGGEATRDFVRRQEFLNSCGMAFDPNRAQRRVGA